jgi:hypothetical protein
MVTRIFETVDSELRVSYQLDLMVPTKGGYELSGSYSDVQLIVQGPLLPVHFHYTPSSHTHV